jgi:Thioredoxin-like
MLKKSLLAAAFIGAALLGIASPASSRAAGLGYDPKADPFEQYHVALEQARAENKLVLVIAGGDWCRWCHVLNRFFKRNDDVRQSVDEAFVVMKVYVGDENYNEDFFAQLPPARGAPHFWIVSPERYVLGSQSTGSLEHGKNGYDKQEFLQFVDHWKERGARVRAAQAR